MSTQMNVVVVENKDKDKVLRSLPAKYNKYAGFAYWLLKQMKEQQILSALAYDDTCSMMNLLSSDIPVQIAFYERFFSEIKVSALMLKRDIKDFKKGNKKGIKKDTNLGEKKVRKSKKGDIIMNTNNDIIAQIVMRANTLELETTLQPTVVEPTTLQSTLLEPTALEPIVQSTLLEPTALEPIVQSTLLEPTVVVEKKRGRKKTVKSEEKVVEEKVEEKVVKKRVEKKKKMVEEKVEEKVVEEKVVKKRVEKKKKMVEKMEEKMVEKMEEKMEEKVEEKIQGLHHFYSVSIDHREYFYDYNNRLYDLQHNHIGSFDPSTLSISIH